LAELSRKPAIEKVAQPSKKQDYEGKELAHAQEGPNRKDCDEH
jgi:hypothetical protein